LLEAHTNVDLLELVKTRQDTSTSNTSQDVCTSSLHHGHETFVLQDLCSAVEGALVLDSLARGHHHTTTDGVNRIGEETRSDSDSVAKSKGKDKAGVWAKKDGLQGV